VASVKLWRRISIINGGHSNNNNNGGLQNRRSSGDFDGAIARIRKVENISVFVYDLDSWERSHLLIFCETRWRWMYLIGQTSPM